MAMVGAVGGGLAAVTMALSVAAVHIIHTIRVVLIGVNVGGGLGGGGEESRKSAKTQPRGTCTLWVS